MWTPQPGAQAAAYSARFVDELFYGGERGGGKSDLQLGYQEDCALRYDGKSRGIMFRKTYTELEELQARAMEVFPSEGAIYKSSSSEKYPFNNCWYWPNGATCKMRYIEHERDYGRYHGQQYSNISFDEVTEYSSPAGLLKMLSTLRNANGVPCTVRSTGNPGGVGHGWVKGRYVSIANPRTVFIDEESSMSRMYVPSKTSDNKILLKSDANYVNRIIAATNGNDALRKAWLEGDWDIVAGAFFDCWSKSRHVIRPFDIPADWLRFRAGDWGSAKPFCFVWFAVVSDDYPLYNGLVLPRGCLVAYREWYGMKDREFNVGLKMTAEEVGAGIWERESKDPKLSYGALDPAAFTADGGPSIHERMYLGSGRNVIFKRADNARVARAGAMGGWDQMRSRLIGESDQSPMLVFFDSCEHSIRTIPLMQHDKDRIEDVDTDLEDHCFTGDTLVSTDKGDIAISLLSSYNDASVYSSDGNLHKYRSAGLIKSNAAIIKLYFDNGDIIRCTPDHKFLTNNGRIQAKDLQGLIILSLSQAQSKNLTVQDIICATNTFKTKVLDCIGRYGLRTMEKLRKVSMSIIKTKTDTIIALQTLNVLATQITYQESMESNQQLLDGQQYLRPYKQPLSGTNQKRAKSGILNTIMSIVLTCCTKKMRHNANFAINNFQDTKTASFVQTDANQRLEEKTSLMILSEIALNAAICLAQTSIQKSKHALKNVDQKKVLKLGAECIRIEQAGHEDVYCITVPDTGNFALSNGMIVSNCADTVRYGCMSRPYAKKSNIITPAKFWKDQSLNELWQESVKKNSRL